MHLDRWNRGLETYIFLDNHYMEICHISKWKIVTGISLITHCIKNRIWIIM